MKRHQPIKPFGVYTNAGTIMNSKATELEDKR